MLQGEVSETFKVGIALRQGDGLSPLLFAIPLERIRTKSRENVGDIAVLGGNRGH